MDPYWWIVTTVLVLKHTYEFEWTKRRGKKEINIKLKSNDKVWNEQGKVIYWLIQNTVEENEGWESPMSCNSEKHKRIAKRLQNYMNWQFTQQN
jgi:hypothetical protein